MAKVFTITPGLENMGAMKTGGQGSVYKGRRIGEVITAIKILPTPIYSESEDDKNFIAFQNEVEKLKKVNEEPNPNVVKILSSGLTETGNLPFIEMEFIKGPDLEDLLKASNDPVFTVKEVLKVAEQLSNALAHCHKLDVKHGDIKSNNVKFNTDTSNYVLLDFGLAIMSDEQRRSSLRQAGAIEFMAPEQNTGQMLFQTDVYSFGIVLFELLAGTVPFPLKDKGESARNEVRLAHMVTPLPDLLSLRQIALTATWDDQKKAHEMQVPDWLINLVYKCLEKKPEARFTNGIALYDFILENYVSPGNNAENEKRISILVQENQRLLAIQEQLQKQVFQYRHDLDSKDEELRRLKIDLQQKNSELQLVKDRETKGFKSDSSRKAVSFKSYIGLLLFTIVLSAFLFFSFLRSRDTKMPNPSSSVVEAKDTVGSSVTTAKAKPLVKNKSVQKKPVSNTDNKAAQKREQLPVNTKTKTAEQQKAKKDIQQKTPEVIQEEELDKKTNETANEQVNTPVAAERKPGNQEPLPRNQKPQNQMEEAEPTDAGQYHRVVKSYLVVKKAHFYKSPDEQTRKAAFIGPWERAIVNAIDERYGFIYVIIKNPQGEIFKGWLRKKDVRLHAIE